jgi:hypothetical protein
VPGRGSDLRRGPVKCCRIIDVSKPCSELLTYRDSRRAPNSDNLGSGAYAKSRRTTGPFHDRLQSHLIKALLDREDGPVWCLWISCTNVKLDGVRLRFCGLRIA